MGWEEYFEKNKGRQVRALYSKAMEYIPAPHCGLTAIDMGVGSGSEAANLVQRGFSLTAIDREPAALKALMALLDPNEASRVDKILSSFEDLTSVPKSNFVFAYHSLPFCKADRFQHLWTLISNSLKPLGIFAGSFFGMADDWVRAGHNVGLTRDELNQLFSAYDLLHLEEINQSGETALNGAKQWHYYEVVARKRS